MSKRQAKSHEVRLSIAYALAQSIKLSVYEGRALDLVSGAWVEPVKLNPQSFEVIYLEFNPQLFNKLGSDASKILRKNLRTFWNPVRAIRK